jgi:hypothetical protein
MPSLGLPQPLPTVRRVRLGTLAIYHFHRAAVRNVTHAALLGLRGGLYRMGGTAKKDSAADGCGAETYYKPPINFGRNPLQRVQRLGRG